MEKVEEKEEQVFEPGDLVEYYEFMTYYYGEGAVKPRGQAIVLKELQVAWHQKAQEWINEARWEPYTMTRYKILCLDTGRRIILGKKALSLISKAKPTGE